MSEFNNPITPQELNNPTASQLTYRLLDQFSVMSKSGETDHQLEKFENKNFSEEKIEQLKANRDKQSRRGAFNLSLSLNATIKHSDQILDDKELLYNNYKNYEKISSSQEPTHPKKTISGSYTDRVWSKNGDIILRNEEVCEIRTEKESLQKNYFFKTMDFCKVDDSSEDPLTSTNGFHKKSAFLEEKKKEILQTQDLIEKFKKFSSDNKKTALTTENESSKSNLNQVVKKENLQLPPIYNNRVRKTKNKGSICASPIVSRKGSQNYLDNSYSNNVRNSLKEGEYITSLPPRYDKSLSPVKNVAVMSNVHEEMINEDFVMESFNFRMERMSGLYNNSAYKIRPQSNYKNSDGEMGSIHDNQFNHSEFMDVKHEQFNQDHSICNEILDKDNSLST